MALCFEYVKEEGTVLYLENEKKSVTSIKKLLILWFNRYQSIFIAINYVLVIKKWQIWVFPMCSEIEKIKSKLL